MKRALFATIAIASLAAACGGAPPQVNWTGPTDDDVTPRLLAAMKEEAIGDPDKAAAMYVDLMEDAVYASPWDVAVLEASVDALITREVAGLAEFSERSALAYRTRDAAFFSADKPDLLTKHMPGIFRGELDSIKKGVIARGMTELSERRGNWADAERWRAASGCAREATMLGPTEWTSIISVRESKNGLEKFDAPLPASFRTPGPFGISQAPFVARGRGCAIDLAAVSPHNGLRTVVADIDVRRKQTIAVVLRAHGEASLRVGGLVAITQPYELGSAEAARFAMVEVEAGRVRLVASVGMNEDGDKLEIDAFTDEGDPIVAHAPRAGEHATSRALQVQQVTMPEPKNDAQRVALALAAISNGDERTAENLLEEASKQPNASPELLLTYARAVASARDLSPVHRADRARGAYERVIDAWPGSWEAVLAHGVLAGVKRGSSDARIETLKDVDTHRAKASAAGAALIDAFDAAISGREHLYGRAADAFARAKTKLDKTAILHDAEDDAFARSDDDAAKFACSGAPPTDRSSFGCYSALHAKGDLAASSRELERLRALYGAPDLFASLVLHDAVARDDHVAARDAFEALFPGEKSLSAVASFAADKGKPRTPEQIRSQLLTIAATARDAPAALSPILNSLGDDPAKEFDAQALEVTRQDRDHPLVEGAATAMLAHVERYEVMDSGLFHYVLFDVRRVNGTADVDENAQADAPDFDGRTAFRVLRKRIIKKDGRIVEPDNAPNAAQGHADLSQLEQGDSIEAVYEGYGVPGETGDIGIDTPDLLPDRVGVASASIEIRLPAALSVHMWQHPLLGKPTEIRSGSTRVLHWNLQKHGVRHVEDGTPKMDRSVGVSLSTAEWSTVALSLRETQAALVDHDPEVAAWAREAAKLGANEKPKPSMQMVEAIVRAAGDAVHEASPAVLSDIGAGGARGPQSMTARTILTDHEGSRTWLIVRALRELGVTVDVDVAENEPFSADANFPPHFGRFLHPLAVAHIPDANKKIADIWIDADVEGPPLPAGHLSPELRGRALLMADGNIGTVPNLGSNDEGDEIDIRLALDDAGNAKGDVTALLRGRAAQEIAEALTRVVGFERERALRNVVLGWVPYANVNEVALSSSEGSWQIALRASISVGSYAQVEQTGASQKTWILPGIDPVHYVFPRAGVATLSSTYASERARESALAIGHAIQYHAHRRIELPPGAKVARLPGPFEIKGASLGASRKIAVAGSTIEDDFSLSVATTTIAPKDYAAFVDSARRADDSFLSSTRVTPK